MARPRSKYCPKGHDKDAPGGSCWRKGRTLKGTINTKRSCAICDKLRIKAIQLKKFREKNHDLIVELARELYDRFVMGGWEPQDTYAWIEQKLIEQFNYKGKLK